MKVVAIMAVAVSLTCGFGQVASAQTQAAPPDQVGQVAKSSAGQVGQRQTREQSERDIQPMQRLANRIPNRVQSRVRTRIDRNYDPQAFASNPFAVADSESRRAGHPAR